MQLGVPSKSQLLADRAAIDGPAMKLVPTAIPGAED
jgi:hypothetical protein